MYAWFVLPSMQNPRAVTVSGECAQALLPAFAACAADTVQAAAELPGCCEGLDALPQACQDAFLFTGIEEGGGDSDMCGGGLPCQPWSPPPVALPHVCLAWQPY